MMNVATVFSDIVNQNIKLEFTLINKLRDKYLSEYDFNCARCYIKKIIIYTFELQFISLVSKYQDDLSIAIERYIEYIAFRIYA